MEEIRICNYLPGEEIEIFELVKTSFNEFVAVDCDEFGVNFFLNFIEPEELFKRSKSDSFILTAKDNNNQIVGMIEVTNDGHICLLFVKNEFQRKGISKKLFDQAKHICKINSANQILMSVNSSIFAVDIYKKLGFETISKEKKVNGISFIEMTFYSK
jgi:ribosomal protein S18 acetylase RimI-like enzyme